MPRVVMSVVTRAVIAGLAVAVLAVAGGTAVIPTHVSFGAGRLRCGTVLHPDRENMLAASCGEAGANQLRATLVLGAVLLAVAVVPLFLRPVRPAAHPAVWAAWIVILLVVAVVGIVSLTRVAYSPSHIFIDL